MNRQDFIRLVSFSGLSLLLQPIRSLATPPLSTDVLYYRTTDKEYDQLRRGFNLRINKFPNIIAVCLNTQGVQQAILLAQKMNLAVSIQSGGHCMEGFSGSEGGMQLVLRNMNTMTWIGEYEIKVGPGCTLQKIYEEIIPKQKIIPGGSCASVGIGGLALGGGYGLLSRLFGLTCDSLLSITMVDGTGQIVHSDKNPELLWACKGGGNGNFGVITEMTFKVHNRPRVMSSYRFRSFKVSTSKAKEILKTWMELAATLPDTCFSTCLFNRDTAYILLTNVGKQTKDVQHFISVMQGMHTKTTKNLNQPLDLALKNFYGQAHPVKFKNASAGLYHAYAELEPALDEILAIVFKSRGMILQFNTLGGRMTDKTLAKASAFPHRDYVFFTELQTYWEEDSQAIRCMNAFDDVQQIIQGMGVKAQYRNYPDINFRSYEELYYGNNLSRLQAIKKRYDPKDIIRHPQSIGLPKG